MVTEEIEKYLLISMLVQIPIFNGKSMPNNLTGKGRPGGQGEFFE